MVLFLKNASQFNLHRIHAHCKTMILLGPMIKDPSPMFLPWLTQTKGLVASKSKGFSLRARWKTSPKV